MRITEIRNAGGLKPLKLPAREVPHAVIEPNYTCNRRCAACYNQFRDVVKPFEQITAEVDLAVAKRNLETISILGGEPTLHARLPEIVRYIKSKSLVCQVLSNGLTLLQDGGDRLLDRLLDAGLDRIVVHVDCGQGLNEKEVEGMRQALFDKFEQRCLYFGLAITLYPQNPDGIPGIMRRYARYRFFDGVLGTVVRDVHGQNDGSRCLAAPDLAPIYSEIATKLGVEPASYLPSSLDDGEVRWLIYFYYLNARTGVGVSISPRFSRLMRRAYRVLTGRHLFAITLRPLLSKPWFLFTAAAESLLRPSRLPEFAGLAVNSSALDQLRFQYIVLQAAPQVNAAKVEICYHCPDATIRNGRLAPVCLADWMDPPDSSGGGRAGNRALAEAVYAHLGEAA